MQSSPSVSVIIPARDAALTLERTLQAVLRQVLDEPFEVIVVDDGSRDETPAIVERHEPLVKLLRANRSEGAGAARNQGARVAHAPVLAFTDADCFPTPQWLARGLARLARADLVQGRVEPDPSAPRTPFDRSLSVERDGSFYQTANLVVRREVFDAVGGFRDWTRERTPRWRVSPDSQRRAAHRPVGEDTLFGWTARRQGARSTFAPDALVHHAVFPGGVRDAIADRWNWTTKMPGLARLVPELRDGTFYRHWFFAEWSAQFDLAVGGVLASALTESGIPLFALLPYIRRIWGEAASYDDGLGTPTQRLRRRVRFLLGAPAVDAATLAGFVVGSCEWRSLVL